MLHKTRSLDEKVSPYYFFNETVEKSLNYSGFLLSPFSKTILTCEILKLFCPNGLKNPLPNFEILLRHVSGILTPIFQQVNFKW